MGRRARSGRCAPMSTTTSHANGETLVAPAPDATDALVERLFGATLGALELFSTYLGAELGLYRTLDERGALTAPGLAEAAGIAPRYAHEWLEQQAVAGLVAVDDPGAEPAERRYELPEAHARALARPEDPAHVAPFAHMLAGIGGVLPQRRGGLPHRRRRALRRLRRGVPPRAGPHQPPGLHPRAADGLAGRHARRGRAPAGRRAAADRRRRLRAGLVDRRGRRRVPQRRRRRARPRSRLDRRRPPPRRGCRRAGQRSLRRGRRRRARGRGALRPRADPRGPARPGPPGRGAAPPRARRWPTAAPCSSSTRGSPSASPLRATRSSG